MEVFNINTSELIPYKNNAKRHNKKQVEQVANSIKRFGFVQPIVIDKNNEIIIGHCRYLSAKQLDLETVPALRVENLTEDEIKALRLADNKLNESEWDLDLALPELKGLDIELQELTGFDKELLIEPEERDDEVPEVPETPRSVLGDLYELGEHRLLVGDCTILDNVEKLMNGKKADMVFTDPPYGINLDVSNSDNLGGKDGWKNKAKHYSKIIGDDKDYDPSHLFIAFPETREMFLWGFDYYADKIPDRNKGSVIVWDKRDGVENMKLTFSEFELCWSKQKHLREIARVTWSGLLGTEQEFDHKRYHPTQKPIKLSAWFVSKYSKENQLVIDLFLGSGSTLIACEKTGRICYGMELDCHYVDVCVERWCQYTGIRDIVKNGQNIRWETES